MQRSALVLVAFAHLLACSLLACAPAARHVLIDGGAGDATPTGLPTPPLDGGGPHTTYPIVMAHGWSGFENIGSPNYFYGVSDALRKDGFTVYAPQVDPYNSSEKRGAELLTYVQGVLAETHADKVDLICHSQGGLDCRYVASLLGAHVAAVVTVATPHHGVPLADIALGDVPGPLLDAVDAIMNLIGAAGTGQPNQDQKAAFESMSTRGAAAFNAKFPDDPRVAYFSIAGRSNNSRGDDACGAPTEAPLCERWDTYVDSLNAPLAPSAAIINSSFTPPPTNDGLVPVASARWGTFLGCIPADHWKEVCQPGGAMPTSDNPFDCVILYRQIAQFLVERGY